MSFVSDHIETLRLNITDLQALEIRREALNRGAFKVNISRLHSQLIEIEIFNRPQLTVIDVTPKRLSR